MPNSTNARAFDLAEVDRPAECEALNMTHTYDELHKMTVAQLREVAAGIDHEAVQGATQMNQEHLLLALCKALGIESHAHHEVVGVNKAAVKVQIRALKVERDAALEAHDSKQLKRVRHKIHRLKHQLRRATV